MTADQNEKDLSTRTEQEAKPGSDWEDAFQAEDYLIPTVTASKTLFDEVPQEETEPSAPLQEDDAEASDPSAKDRVSGAGFGALLKVLNSLVKHLPSRLQQLSVFRLTKQRGAFVGLAVALCCVFLLLYLFHAEPEKTGEARKSLAVVEGGSPEVKEKGSVLPVPTSAPVSPPSEKAVIASPSISSEAVEKGIEDGAARRKWRFSSFMINASQDEGATPSYVVVDLSLVLRLRGGEDFPEGKEYAIREMIYQFFSNRPLYELRRFSLARGEMKQKLQAWFQKEWPDNPIESVFFHRYQII